MNAAVTHGRVKTEWMVTRLVTQEVALAWPVPSRLLKLENVSFFDEKG